MTRKPSISPRVAAEIKALEQAIDDARTELRELKRKESLARRRPRPVRRGKPG
jgi:multidrug efflux pump subunit AcrA (membrane-fusion protein)